MEPRETLQFPIMPENPSAWDYFWHQLPYGFPGMLSTIGGIVLIFFLISRLIRDKNNPDLWAYLGVLVGTSSGAMIYALRSVLMDRDLLLDFHYVLYYFFVFVTPSFSYLTYSILGKNSKILKLLYYFSFCISIPVFMVLINRTAFSGEWMEYSYGNFPIAGSIWLKIWGLSSLINYLISLPFFIQYYKATKKQLYNLPIHIGLHSLGILAFSGLPSLLGIPFYPGGNFFLIGILILFYGLSRSNFKEFESFFIERRIGFYVTSVLSSVLLVGLGVLVALFVKPIADRSTYSPVLLLPLASVLLSFLFAAYIAGVNPGRKFNLYGAIALSGIGCLQLILTMRNIELPIIVQQRLEQILYIPFSISTYVVYRFILMTTEKEPSRILDKVLKISISIVAIGSLSPFLFTGYYTYWFGMVSEAGVFLNLLVLAGFVMNYDLSVTFIRQWRLGQLNRDKKLVFISFGLFWILTMGNIPATMGFEIFPSSYIMFLPLGILSYQIVKIDSIHNKGKVAEITNRISALNLGIIPLMMLFYFSQLSEDIDLYQRILHCLTVGSPLIVGTYTITFILSRPIAKELDSNMSLLEVEKTSLQKERELSESRRKIAIELANDLKFTNEITKEINASPDLSQIMKIVMNFMEDEFGIKDYGIFRVSPDKNYLIPYQISDTTFLSIDEKNKLMNIKIPFMIPESAHYLPYHSRRVLYFSKMNFKIILPEDKEVMDIIQPKSYLFMPLVVNESVIGFLDFTNFRGKEFSLSKNNLSRIKSIADHIASSLHKTFLMDSMMETQKGNYDLAQKMQYLNEISKEFNETLDIETIKSMIVDYSKSRFGLHHIAIWLVDPSKSYLYPYAGSYPEEISQEVIDQIFQTHLTIDKDSIKGAHNLVYFKKRTIALEGLDERYATEEEMFISNVYNLNRWIISPLIIKSEVIGLIYFQGQSTGKKTTRSQIKDIESFVQQISGSIYNASLIQNLNTAYTELQESQDQLVQSEKMAALGQLIAGVAHEINTPLGAIKASIENITHSLEESLNLFPDYITSLSLDQKNLFLELIDKAKRDKRTLSTKEDRKWKGELRNTLEANDIPKSDEIADSLVDIGIYEGVEPFLPLFQSNPDDTIQLAYNLAGFQIKAKNIKSAVEKASKIVFALKNYAHSDSSGQKILSNIIEGIETVLTIYQNSFKKGVELHTEFDPIPAIYCYPDELNQIWTNLIHNSLQAMDYNGKLILRAFTESSVKEDYNNENNEDESEEFIVIQIEDDGPGIPTDLQEKIFNPFFTTKKRGEGSGLGLHITRKILDKHNGNLSLDSKPGRTVFTIKIPMLKKQEKIS